jgi:hypothetical protein
MELKKQVAAPGIPRFNPHGYQPPPVENEVDVYQSLASYKSFSIKK